MSNRVEVKAIRGGRVLVEIKNRDDQTTYAEATLGIADAVVLAAELYVAINKANREELTGEGDDA